MSHFGETLTALMELEEITQLDLAESTGISRSILSRFCNGHLAPTRDMLARLVNAISDDRDRRLELLLAHLRDEAAVGVSAGIAPENYVIARATSESEMVVPLHLQATFHTLVQEASRPDRPEVRELLESVVNMILAGKAETADAAARAPIPFEPLVAEGKTPPASQSVVSAVNAGLSATASTKLSDSPRPSARGKNAGKRTKA
jgi:transcriptional regulator with XRE-family HTH domain